MQPPSQGFASDSIINELINSLNNQELRDLLNGIRTLIDTSVSCLQINEGCYNIINHAQSNLNEMDAIIVEVVCYITMNSCQYWTTNYDFWGTIFHNITYNIKSNDNNIFGIDNRAKRILKRDAEAAIGGAITGALAGTPVLGVGAGAGAILGACLGATYGSAFEGFWVAIGW